LILSPARTAAESCWASLDRKKQIYAWLFALSSNTTLLALTPFSIIRNAGLFHDRFKTGFAGGIM
jgi:hypothetical protein